ncbi:MAG: radical SAM protein [Candidatus Aminicenantes bacterium]|nr:radical SAM protein [Candidatus Aminicenantes bacterium]
MDSNEVILLNPPGDKLYIRDYYCSFSSKADYYWPPQDLIYLSGILNEEYSVRVIDAIINRQTEDDVLSEIEDSGARALIFTTGTATMQSDLRLMERVKAKSDIKIIASAGILPFIGNEFLKRYEYVDALLLDFTSLDICVYIRSNDQLDDPLQGLITRKNGQFIQSTEKLLLTYTVPVPRHDLFDFKKYRIPIARRFPFTVVVTSLGCPHSCGFCTAGAYGYRTRDVDGVIEELRLLSRLGVKEILFQDPTFTINTNRVVELCSKMVENKFDFTWSCNADIKSFNEDKIKHMKAAGCHTVSLGIESGNEKILQKYSKKITTEEIKSTIRMLNEYKIRVLGYFIIGLPGEDEDSIRQTIDLAKQLDIDFASFAIATPDVGTPLRREALQKGWMRAEKDVFDSTDFPVLETGNLSKEDVWKLRSQAVREFYLRPSYLFKKVRQIRSFRDVKLAASNALSLFRKS